MADHYKMAEEVKDEELDFPEPKSVRQYKQPIGPQKPQHEGVLQRIAKVAAPGLAGEAEALGKGGARALAGKTGGAITRGISNAGQRVGHLIESQPPAHLVQVTPEIPVWLRDQKAGKTKNTRIPGSAVPAWVHGGGMPWDNPRQHSDVERVIVTRIHADGSRTVTHRNVPTKQSAPKLPKDRKPSWIKF